MREKEKKQQNKYINENNQRKNRETQSQDADFTYLLFATKYTTNE